MNRYETLVFRYLMEHKLRTVMTCVGLVMATVMIYGILAAGRSGLQLVRNEYWEENGYDMVFFVENQETGRAIGEELLEKKYIKRCFFGVAKEDEYYEDYGKGEQISQDSLSIVSQSECKTAMYMTSRNTYQVRKIFKKIQNEYHLNGYVEQVIAALYGQDDESDHGMLGTTIAADISLVLLICFVVASFLVAMTKNTLRISVINRMKDYGILRCSGLSIRQLRSMLVLEAMYMGIPSLLIGLLLGILGVTGLSVIVVPSFSIGVYWEPVVITCLIVIGCLYFSLIEPMDSLKKMTPIENLHATYRMKGKEIRRCRKSIWFYLFGIEGDYAYKNLIRNRRRLVQMILSVSFICISAMITANMIYAYQEMVAEDRAYNGYYQVQIDRMRTGEAVTEPYTKEDIGRLSTYPGIGSVKKSFSCMCYPDMSYHERKIEEQDGNRIGGRDWRMVFGESLTGYDKDDLERLSDNLIDGSLDLKEGEIAIVTYGEIYDPDYDGLGDEYRYGKVLELQIGDTITICDPKSYREACRKEGLGVEPYTDIVSFEGLVIEKLQKQEDVIQKLIAEGSTKQYTVKALLRQDNGPRTSTELILPIDEYVKFTGFSMEDYSGYSVHVEENMDIRQIEKRVNDELSKEARLWFYNDFSYCYVRKMLNEYGVGIIVFGIFGAFFTLSSLINVFNTAIAVCDMRKGEFAFLRAIGISKKKLRWIVLLEYAILVAIAMLITTICMLLLFCAETTMYYYLVSAGGATVFRISVLLLVWVSVTIVICGMVWFIMKKQPDDIAQDLSKEL